MVDFIDKAICNNENDFWNHKIGQSLVKAIVTKNLIKKEKIDCMFLSCHQGISEWIYTL